MQKYNFYGLTNPQRSIWLQEQFFNDTTVNNICVSGTIYEKIDLNLLKRAVNETVRQNDAFRIRIKLQNEIPMQYIKEFQEFDIEIAKTKSEKDFELIEKEEVKYKFNIIDSDLYKFKIAICNDNCAIVILTAHHIIADSWSLGLTIQEILRNYHALLGVSKFEATTSSYIDYIESEKQYKENQKFQNDKQYWNEVFTTIPEQATIPSSYTETQNLSYKANRLSFNIDAKLLSSINEFCTLNQISTYVFFMSIFAIYTSRVSNLDDFVLGTPILNRTSFKEKHTMGMFVNTVPVRFNGINDFSFKDFSSNVSKNIMGIFRHQKYSYNTILDDLRENNKNIPNLYNIILSYQITKAFDSNFGNYKTNWTFNNYCANDFNIHIFDINDTGSLILSYDYLIEKYSEKDINDIQNRIIHIISQIISNPDILCNEIEIVTPEEKNQILNVFNNTSVDYPKDKTIVDLFEEQVQKNPDNIAVVFDNQKLTYRELNEKANSLAHIIKNSKIRKEESIGLFMDKSLEMIVGIIAILKTGLAYLPIDIDSPASRIEYILQNSNCNIVLTKLQELPKNLNLNIINISLDNDFYKTNTENLNLTIKHNNLAYIIYTSGSTGTPKGVMVEHRNVVRLIKNTNYIKFESNDKILQSGSIVFDASTFEIWGALLNGLELYIIKKEDLLNPVALKTFINKYHISSWFLTTALFNKLCEEDISIFDCIKNLLTGGEVLSPKHINKLFKHNKNINLNSVYGPTENTTFSTFFPIIRTYSASIPIGKPISNSTCYVVSKYGMLQPVGVPGELLVGGDGVSRGYINQKDLTQDKFIANPFGLGQIYKTGDLVKWLPDGSIDFLGRIDNQVKIRGFRIELDEINLKILEFPEVKQSYTTIYNTNNQKYICSYIIFKDKHSENNLKKFLRTVLPSYMIPSYIVELDKLPLNINGKVDKSKLPEPIQYNKNIIQPRNDIDKFLISKLRKILNIKNISIDDTLIELGIDSLTSITLSTVIYDKYHVQIPVKNILNNVTIEQLSNFIQTAESTVVGSTIPKAHMQEFYPLSSAQRRIYYAAKMIDEKNTVYNVPGGLLIDGILDITKIKNAFNEIIKRHSSFRTSFVLNNDSIMQKIMDNISLEIPVYNSTKSDIDKILSNFSKPFDLEKAPLLRVEVHFIDNLQTLILMDSHHIVIDGTGINNLINEFSKLYAGEKLKPLPIQYVDYSVWENNSNISKPIEQYWLNKFTDSDFLQLNLPYDYTISNKTYHGSKISKIIDADLFSEIQDYSKKSKVSPYMLCLSALFILLYKYTGQDDINIGSPVANRDLVETKQMIGMFVNNIVIRGKINSEDTFSNFLNSIKEQVLNDLSNQSYPFDTLIKSLGISSSPSNNPLFDIMFAYQNQEEDILQIDGNDCNIIEFDNKTAKFNLSLEIKPATNTINLEYCTDLFKKQTIERFFEHYINTLKCILSNHEIKIKDIQIISEEEKNKIIYKFNDTKLDYPIDKTISQLFEEQVEKTPHQVALVFEDTQLTYIELNEKANQLASYIRNAGIHPNEIIGIMLPRSLELLIAILGVLKSGACYIPIDPTYPEKRISYMLSNSKAKMVLTTDELFNKIKFTNKICIDLNNDEIYHLDKNNLENVNLPEDTSYIIYTSGSTGLPKGVLLKHKSLSNLCAYLNQTVDFLKDNCKYKNMCSITTVSFDIFIFETLVCLQRGLKIVLANEDEQRIPVLLDKLIDNNNIELIQMTPSRMQIFLDNIKDMPHLCNLKYITLAGEALPIKLRDALKNLGILKIYNGYGPSETTVFSSFTDVTNVKEISIGKPLANTQMYILDSNLAPVPIGIPGELYISGDGVGNGYLNRYDLTNEKYINDPYSNNIMYKTGDICKFDISGNIHYLGRVDNQVKIRGLRVELEEIENKIIEFPHIKRAKVIKQTINDREILSAYFISSSRIRITELRKYLYSTLPNYMIPSYFTPLDKFPYTPNGKIDKNSLPIPAGILQTEHKEYIAPNTDLEVKLVSIWEDILNTKPIGIYDNFFELGGDSVLAMNLNIKLLQMSINIKYADIFTYPTIVELAKKIQDETENPLTNSLEVVNDQYQTILNENMHIPNEVNYHSLNNILLTGATGFLGMHILSEFLNKEKGKIYVIVRKDPGISLEDKFINKLHYYFGTKYDSYINNRIILIEGNISDNGFGLNQEDLFKLGNSVSSIINSAAKVSHYGNYSEFYNVNVKSVEKLIDFANLFKLRLFHISTLSISGNAFVDQYYLEQNFENTIQYSENNFYINQKLDNVYIRSKFEAERKIFDAILKGTDAYILRMGNLMPRLSDGKFQENIDENAYINRLSAFKSLGCFPDYLLNAYLEFTPIDKCAEAIIKILQYTNSKNRIYHLFNHNHVYIKDIIAILPQLNINIKVLENDEFKKLIREILNSSKSEILNNLINDLDKDLIFHYDSKIELKSDHTIKLLDLFGFKWTQIDKKYLINILNLLGDKKYDS